jgi:hypothetical protein
MKSFIFEVPRKGLQISLVPKVGFTSGQIVLVLPDEIEILQEQPSSGAPFSAKPIISDNGFPPRRLTEQTIIQILREHGGSVKISDSSSGWRIYDEIAARLGVSIEARNRLTSGTGEPAWRPEVGFARKNLERSGVLEPTEVSGRGFWKLKA